MARYLDESGDPVTSEDPYRTVWYSRDCGYWTDDWDKVNVVEGIPCCPKCGCVGYQATAKQWEAGALLYQESHSFYYEFVQRHKEVCNPSISLITLYRRWFKAKDLS